MNKKIFVIHASAGGGHRKAATSLIKAFEELGFRHDITLIDSLDYTNNSFKKSYQKTYLLAIQKLQNLWGFFYYLLDNAVFYKFFVSFARRIVNQLNTKPLRDLIIKEKPDLILCTHFLAPEVIGNMKNKGLIDTKLVTVITDFKPHTFWVHSGIDYYIVADQYTKDELVKRGVSGDKILVYGIPIEKAFSIDYDKNELRQKFGMKDIFTVLIGSGGWGVGPIEKLVDILGQMDEELQVMVVCGENDILCNNISRYASDFKNFVKVFGYVNNMYELMSIADVIVTKSGGLTTSESLAKDLPMIIIAPIPGQETRNCDFILNSKAGFKINNPEDVRDRIKELINSKELLNKLKDNISKIRKPNSSLDIARFCLKLIGN